MADKTCKINVKNNSEMKTRTLDPRIFVPNFITRDGAQRLQDLVQVLKSFSGRKFVQTSSGNKDFDL